MASLPLQPSQWQPAPASKSNAGSIVGKAEPAARLSTLEWSIVAMAERDKVSSLREPGRFITALNAIFGLKRPNRLANERLEALRRIAILAWNYRWNVPKLELQQFFAAGFTPSQYELIQTSIGQARLARTRKTVR